MFGNCATGKLMIVIVPRITITIEITMATMGRLMKNFDMAFLPCLRRRIIRHVRLRLYLRTGLHFLHSLGHYAFSRLQSVSDNPQGADAIADLDCPYADFVVPVHHSHLISP